MDWLVGWCILFPTQTQTIVDWVTRGSSHPDETGG
jgi:hypothetical protein